MLPKIDEALAAIGALLLVPAVLGFRLVVASALILLILAWATADACRRRLLAPGAAQAGAAARVGS